jgi:hypothetical protein
MEAINYPGGGRSQTAVEPEPTKVSPGGHDPSLLKSQPLVWAFMIKEAAQY